MLDQAADLRRMMDLFQQENAAPSTTLRTIAVTSGKGGVGKTNIAVNLTLALAEKGARVALLDADWGLSNTELLLGMAPNRDLRHVLRGECEIDEIVCVGPLGMKLIPGASGVAEVANLSSSERDRLIAGLSRLERLADIVVLDTSPGIADAVIDLAAGADQVLVVTTPEPTSLTDAYAFAKVVLQRRRDAEVGLLVNMADDRSHAENISAGFNSVTERFLGCAVPMTGFVCKDMKVQQAVRRQSPLLLSYPNSPAAGCFRQLADSLLGHESAAPAARSRGRSLLQRFGFHA